MLRWWITISVSIALLFNCAWVMRCGPGSTENNIVSAPSGDEDLPECCRNGMCPHGGGPHTNHVFISSNDIPDCTCGMSPTDSSVMVMLAAVPVVSPSSQDAIVLEPTGTALHALTPSVMGLPAPPSTPPPKA